MSTTVLIGQEQIAQRVREMGKELGKLYKDKDLLVACILKGSSIFFADLIRQINLDIEVDFVAVSSYGSNSKSSGEVRLLKDFDNSIEGKNVLLVEDIVDTGLTLSYLKKLLLSRKPKSLKICSLLDKPESRKTDIKADFVGFSIENVFVVGYGLDYAQKYRNLPDVCILSLD